LGAFGAAVVLPDFFFDFFFDLALVVSEADFAVASGDFAVAGADADGAGAGATAGAAALAGAAGAGVCAYAVSANALAIRAVRSLLIRCFLSCGSGDDTFIACRRH
jgi:hypothetical protein